MRRRRLLCPNIGPRPVSTQHALVADTRAFRESTPMGAKECRGRGRGPLRAARKVILPAARCRKVGDLDTMERSNVAWRRLQLLPAATAGIAAAAAAAAAIRHPPGAAAAASAVSAVSRQRARLHDYRKIVKVMDEGLG